MMWRATSGWPSEQGLTFVFQNGDGDNDVVGEMDGDADVDVLGGAMLAEPMKPMLKAPGIKRLKLEYDKLLSSLAFDCNLRHYSWGMSTCGRAWHICLPRHRMQFDSTNEGCDA